MISPGYNAQEVFNIDTFSFTAVADSGASRSVVSKSFERYMYDIQEERITLTSISNDVPVTKRGKIDILLENKHPLTIEAIIMDNCLKQTFIISLNQLVQYDISIHLRKDRKFLK